MLDYLYIIFCTCTHTSYMLVMNLSFCENLCYRNIFSNITLNNCNFNINLFIYFCHSIQCNRGFFAFSAWIHVHLYFWLLGYTLYLIICISVLFVVDYCHGIQCNHGYCDRGQNGYTCICNPGYWGTHCNQSKLS